MDTFEDKKDTPLENLLEELNDQPIPAAAEVPAQEPVPAEEPKPAAQIPAQEPASQTVHTENPGWNPGYSQPAQQGYYPPQYQQPAPQSGYYHYQYRQPAPQPGYYQPGQPQPGAYQQPPVYAEPGTRQNAYVPPRPQAAPVPPVPPVPKAKKKKKGGFWKGLVAAILILALVGGSCAGTALYVNHQWEERAEAMTESFNSQIGQLQEQIAASSGGSGLSVSGTYAPTGDAMTPAQVYAQNVQTVVAISSTVAATSAFGQATTGTATGSGFIVTSDGYVVTNYHVVEGATAITVTTNAGNSYDASLIGYDSTNDVAVLKVEAQNLPSVAIGSSSSLIVGDQVVAIGNPLGELTNTLTVGYVSAKDRMVTTDGFGINMLQTDAAINSGNSGGPLFNMYGEVVGITSAKYSGSSSSGANIEGIGFAIPIDDVLDLIQDLVNDGYVSSGYLGVSVSDYEMSYASYYNLPANTPAGAYVQIVVEGYSAARAGVQVGDVVVALGDRTINGVTSLTRALRDYEAGDTTTITVYRGGEKLELTITLDEKPDDTESTTETTPEASSGYGGFPGRP